MKMLILFMLFLALSHGQTFQFTSTEVESWTFTEDPTAPGMAAWIDSQAANPVLQIIELGQLTVMMVGVNVTGLINATTLTSVWTMRDFTTMPEVTLANITQALARGTVMATVSINISSAPLSIAATNYTNGISSYPMGSSDSYGNIFQVGHIWGMDRTLFFTTPVINQNVTINKFGLFPTNIIW
jgi:hypothetical protein